MPEIIKKEIKDARTKSAKIFDLGNGQKQYEFHCKPIHYKDENGSYQNIDCTLNLEQSYKDFQHYISTKNKVTVGFRADGKFEKMCGIRNDYNHQFEVTLLDYKVDGVSKIVQQSTFSDVTSNEKYTVKSSMDVDTDIEHKVNEVSMTTIFKSYIGITDFFIKEQIHLKGYVVKNKQDETGEYVPNDKNQFVICDLATGEEVYKIKQPMMWNDELNNMSFGIKHKLYEENGKLIYTKEPTEPDLNLKEEDKPLSGKEWLQQASAPLYIDANTYYGETGDGCLQSQSITKWSYARDATSADYTYPDLDGSSGCGIFAWYEGDCSWCTREVRRSMFCFDTSGLDSGDEIASAEFKVYCGGTVCNAIVEENNNINDNTVDANDFDDGTGTAWSSSTSLSTNQYNTITLNSTAISNIGKDDYTSFFLREKDHDWDNVCPTQGDSHGAIVYYSDYTGTSYDPKLIITIKSAPTVTVSGNHTDFYNATITGNVTDDGGGSITQRKIFWGTTDEGEVEGNWDNSYSAGSGGTGTFEKAVSSLNDNTTYYYKANATNSEGTSWSATCNFTTPPHPNVTLNSIDKYKISDETGMDQSTVKFEFDTAVSEYKLKVLGTSHDSGTLAGSGTAGYSANEEITEYVDDEELQQEGINRINIYGKEQNSGYWSKYDS